MKSIKYFIVLFLIVCGNMASAQNPVNWTKDQLVEPSVLAEQINSNKDLPVIISIGPGATIPHSVNIGMVNTDEGLVKLKNYLKTLSASSKIVIYCGCCPFEHCPNVRPAIDVLKEKKFTNYFLLNIPKNMKVDWIDKGYPVKS